MTTDDRRHWWIAFAVSEQEYWTPGPDAAMPTMALAVDCIKRCGAKLTDTGGRADDPEADIGYEATTSVHHDVLELLRAAGIKVLSAEEEHDS